MSLHLGRRRSGFTLVELLIVMAIIAVLIGLLLPAVAKVRESAYRAQCTNNLGNLGKAFISYQGTAGALPPSVIRYDAAPNNSGWATWAVVVLPHIDQENVYKAWDLTQRYAAQTNAAREVSIPMFFCPSRRNTVGVGDFVPHSTDGGLPGALSDYVVCDGNRPDLAPTGGDGGGAIIAAETLPNGSWKSRTRLSSIQRGASNTLMVGEKHVPTASPGFQMGQGPYFDNSVFNGSNQGTPYNAGSWSKCVGSGIGLQKDPTATADPASRQFGSSHATGVNFAFCDGSVRHVPYGTPAQTSTGILDQLARRALLPSEQPLTPDF